MTLPASGPISFNAINVELGQAGTTTANINQASYRTLAGVPSGTISLGNFYGKSNRVAISLTASGNNYDVFANRGGSYVPGTSDITVTVPGTVGSANTGSYAMLVPSGFSPGDTVTIVNNGVIQGAGGAGGGGGNGSPSGATAGAGGAPGGSALYVNRPVTIQNNNTIASGGGGGGGGGAAFNNTGGKSPTIFTYGGGGGGGGSGTNGGGGGAAGSGQPVAAGVGGGGTSGGGGGGGVGGGNTSGGPGGAGGGRGSGGAGGTPRTAPGGGGGGTGNYIVGNGFVTWTATGTRQGGVG
jgi:hypothetical protein